MNEAGSGPGGRGELRIAVLLALCATLFYLPFHHGHFKGSDEVGVFETTRALYENGDLAVPAILHAQRGRDGRHYSFFSVGQSVLALPFYGLGSLLSATLPGHWVRALGGVPVVQGPLRWGGSVEIFAVGLYGPVSSGMLVGLFFLLQRRLGVSRRSALSCAGLLATTTYVAMMSLYFLRHTTEALVILGALYAFLVWKQSGSLRALATGSLLASATVLVRFPSAVSGPALLGYFLWTWEMRRRTAGDQPGPLPVLTALALPALAMAAVHVGVNYWKWGSWLTSPMLEQASAFGNPLAVGLAGFLVSPGCSIFLYSPLLLLCPWTLRVFWRSHRAECATVVTLCVSFLLLSSKFELWTGLWSSPGPRMLFVVTPLLMLPLGPWLDRRPAPPARLALIGLALLGAGVQAVLMTANWPAVIAEMGYQDFVPAKGFVFVPDQSPILGSLRVLSHGQVDAWLWWLWHGWPGRPAAPASAALILTAWLPCFAASLALLWQASQGRAQRAEGERSSQD